MDFLTPEETVRRFPGLVTGVSREHEWYRLTPIFKTDIFGRVGGGFPAKEKDPMAFAHDLSAWLPSMRERLLWISNWEDAHFPNQTALWTAARRGLGETRPLKETPAHVFPAMPYDQRDAEDFSEEERAEVSLLAPIISLMLDTASDGWLLADGSGDRIEFWEGNVFFHSNSPQRLDAARALLANYGCGQPR